MAEPFFGKWLDKNKQGLISPLFRGIKNNEIKCEII